MDLKFMPLNRQKGIQKLYTQMQDFKIQNLCPSQKGEESGAQPAHLSHMHHIVGDPFAHYLHTCGLLSQ